MKRKQIERLRISSDNAIKQIQAKDPELLTLKDYQSLYYHMGRKYALDEWLAEIKRAENAENVKYVDDDYVPGLHEVVKKCPVCKRKFIAEPKTKKRCSGECDKVFKKMNEDRDKYRKEWDPNTKTWVYKNEV